MYFFLNLILLWNVRVSVIQNNALMQIQNGSNSKNLRLNGHTSFEFQFQCNS